MVEWSVEVKEVQKRKERGKRRAHSICQTFHVAMTSISQKRNLRLRRELGVLAQSLVASYQSRLRFRQLQGLCLSCGHTRLCPVRVIMRETFCIAQSPVQDLGASGG